MNRPGKYFIALIVSAFLVLIFHFAFDEQSLREHSILSSGLIGGLCSVITGFVINLYYAKNKIKRYKRYRAAIYLNYRNKKNSSEKRSASLAALYLLNEQKKGFYSYLILVLPLPVLFVVFLYTKISLYPFLFPLGLACIIIAKNTLLKFRIENGYFGYNHYEAMQLINFINKNQTNISNDGGRALRDPVEIYNGNVQRRSTKEGMS